MILFEFNEFLSNKHIKTKHCPYKKPQFYIILSDKTLNECTWSNGGSIWITTLTMERIKFYGVGWGVEFGGFQGCF